MGSPTSRSLEYLRERGWVAHVVEKWIPFRKIRQDCFGADIVAIHPGQRLTMWVQTTSSSNHSARVKKCKANLEVGYVLTVGHLFVVHSWKKVSGHWELRVESLSKSMFKGKNDESENG